MRCYEIPSAILIGELRRQKRNDFEERQALTQEEMS